MGGGVFKTWAMKYHECGIPVIPLNGKIPLVRAWQTWSTKEQTEDEIQDLIQRFPTANIGAVLGLWACALDIDTDDIVVNRAALYSPIRRRGASGAVSLFRPCASPNVPGTDYPVEFLNHGRQIVLPPSVHPDTGQPYQWTGEEDILSLLSHEFPDYLPSNMDQLHRLCTQRGLMSKRKAHTTDGTASLSLTDPGRNNRLTQVAYAIACDGDLSVEQATARLLELDRLEHDTPWFSDPSEPHKGRNPQATAKRMYERALAKAQLKGDRRGPLLVTINQQQQTPPVPASDEPPSSIALSLIAENHEPPPRPRGLIRLFQEACNARAFGNQDALGLGGGLALMAAISSNRFRTQAGSFPIWPNLYLMNLAHSGFGKETPQQLLDEVLMSSGLLGSASYKSGSSIVIGLPEQPHRLDVIDECAMLLKAMSSHEDYKADIVDVLSSLYSKSSTYFHGFTSVANGKSFGACWNPCVNILGSTTPAGFRSSVNKDMAAKGLLPRFLIFRQQDIGEFKGDQDPAVAERLVAEVKRLTHRLLTQEQRLYAPIVQENLLAPTPIDAKRYDPEVIPMSDGAQRAVKELQRRYFNEGKQDPEGFESAFKNRFAQHVCKLALLDALGLGLAEIGVDSVEWAHAVVEWQWRAVHPLYELASASNPHEKDVLEVMQYIKSKKSVKRDQLGRRFVRVPKYRLDDIIKGLETSECIMTVKIVKEGGGRPTTHYEFLRDTRSGH